jgi:hypothetical protein
LSLAASAAVAVLTLVGGAVGLRAMLRPDGRGLGKAAANAQAAPAQKTAPAPEQPPQKAPEPPPPEQATAPTKTADDPVDSPRSTASKEGTRLGKIKKRVVLKTVAEVKKLRAATWRNATTASAKKKAAPIEADDFEDLKRSGKLDKLTKAGKPLPQVFKAGTKAEAMPPEAELKEPLGESPPPDAGTDEPASKPAGAWKRAGKKR